jgi:hypothetical protein
MAYKVQLGNFKASGSINSINAISASNGIELADGAFNVTSDNGNVTFDSTQADKSIIFTVNNSGAPDTEVIRVDGGNQSLLINENTRIDFDKPNDTTSLKFSTTQQTIIMRSTGSIRMTTDNFELTDTNFLIGSGSNGNTNGQGFTIGSTNAVTFQTAEDEGENILESNVPIKATRGIFTQVQGDGTNLTNVYPDFSKTLRPPATAIATSNTNVQSDEHLYLINSSGGSFTLTLPSSINTSTRKFWFFKDFTGDCGTNPVTIQASGSQLIDGFSSIILESPYGAVTLISVHTSNTGSWAIV